MAVPRFHNLEARCPGVASVLARPCLWHRSSGVADLGASYDAGYKLLLS
jgi:hypothetical protein